MRRDLVRAVVAVLRFDAPDTAPLRGLSDGDWAELLHYLDRQHMTLAFAQRCRDALPDWVRERTNRDIAGNMARLERRREAYLEIAGVLRRKGIDWAVLKGLSHDVPLRPQGDIDLLCAPEAAHSAQQAIVDLGYEPLFRDGEFPTDHLPLLIRRNGWRWRGDYYDPEHPPAVEVHFRLWDESTEGIRLDEVEDFWPRRIIDCVDGFTVAALDPSDRLVYASLHALRHLLRGDLLLWHIYELALLLHRAPEWGRSYSDDLRKLAGIAFRLAHDWFGCAMPDIPALPEQVERWFELYGREPPVANKSEVWLHISLLDSRSHMFRVIRRKLLPVQKHGNTQLPHVRDSDVRVRLERMAGQTVFLARRSVHHLRTFIPAVAGGLRWYANRRGLSSAFLGFLGAQSLFNVGMTIFYLLYNLYLLKLGFHEDFVGLVAGATTTGTIVGTLPAGFLISRFGIKPALLFAFTAAPLMCAVRAIGADPNLLLGAAFLSGFAMSLYAVALTPATAQLVAEPARPRAFSLVCSLGIGIGIIGSMLGGALPEWAGGLTPTLLAACAIAGFGGVAALRLPLPAPASRTPHSYPRDPVIFRYLAALSLWSLATGALNPFFNVYFASELRAPIHAIGLIFSASQLTQTVAVLAAPLVLRHFGMPAGIMAMQIATGAMLALLATMPPLAGAAALYAAYMAFQYMSEPGMWTFLMDRARPEERGGAAALNMLIVFAGQAIAATVSGFALRRFGYAAVLVAASLLAVVAGLCFRAALSPRARVLVERSA